MTLLDFEIVTKPTADAPPCLIQRVRTGSIVGAWRWAEDAIAEGEHVTVYNQGRRVNLDDLRIAARVAARVDPVKEGTARART